MTTKKVTIMIEGSMVSIIRRLATPFTFSEIKEILQDNGLKAADGTINKAIWRAKKRQRSLAVVQPKGE